MTVCKSQIENLPIFDFNHGAIIFRRTCNENFTISNDCTKTKYTLYLVKHELDYWQVIKEHIQMNNQ